MKILVTAGNTQSPIDRVRCMTNIFSGRTGARIALEAKERGHHVILLTSHPETASSDTQLSAEGSGTLEVRKYRTFDDLDFLMGAAIGAEGFDAVIHAAAVSDYQVSGVYSPKPGSTFDPEAMTWSSTTGAPHLIDTHAGKISSGYPELWIRLTPTVKLVDKIRSEWNFPGVLVKFKLEVGLADDDLMAAAEFARRQSDADLIVANTLESMHEKAILVGRDAGFQSVPRDRLAQVLLEQIEKQHSDRSPTSI